MLDPRYLCKGLSVRCKSGQWRKNAHGAWCRFMHTLGEGNAPQRWHRGAASRDSEAGRRNWSLLDRPRSATDSPKSRRVPAGPRRSIAKENKEENFQY